MYLGMNQTDADLEGIRGTDEGSKLAGNADLWTDGVLGNDATFGSSGFMVLPGGYRYNDDFIGLGGYAYFWSSAEGFTSSFIWNRRFFYDSSGVIRYDSSDKATGRSVRCIKN